MASVRVQYASRLCYSDGDDPSPCAVSEPNRTEVSISIRISATFRGGMPDSTPRPVVAVRLTGKALRLTCADCVSLTDPQAGLAEGREFRRGAGIG